MELATNTITAESTIGSQSADSGTNLVLLAHTRLRKICPRCYAAAPREHKRPVALENNFLVQVLLPHPYCGVGIVSVSNALSGPFFGALGSGTATYSHAIDFFSTVIRRYPCWSSQKFSSTPVEPVIVI